MSRFIEGDPIKSKVAITTAKTYDDAEKAVAEAIGLLGGPEAICTSKDVVIIKPNMVGPGHPDIAETTHPAVIYALVKILKKTGAIVKVGEESAGRWDTDEAFKATGIGPAALEAGADELVNWGKDERVEVEVPDPRALKVARLPKSVMDADVFIHVPKMKTAYMYNVTLGIKGLLGVLYSKDRYRYHRGMADLAWVTCDIAKAIGAKHRLTLVDGITAMEGAGPHDGPRIDLGVLVASQDMVACEAVSCAVMGFDPFESPGAQVAMKAGLGTAELGEIEILGKSIEEVRHVFKRPLRRFVSKWKNVKEYIGGTCEGCLLTITRVPFIVDPKKTYAVVAGKDVFIPDNLEADEIWLLGTCANKKDHQLPHFAEKIKHIKTVQRFRGCPGIYSELHECYKHPLAKGTPYEIRGMFTADGARLATLPSVYRHPSLVEEAEARREGKMTLEEVKKKRAGHK